MEWQWPRIPRQGIEKSYAGKLANEADIPPKSCYGSLDSEVTMSGRNGGIVRFGDFEVNLGTRELRRDGVNIKLQDQPFAVLAILLEKPGELVTRDEFKERIWGSETYVDFDQVLNKAIKNIRSALGDSAEQPIYIETLPKRGYRFKALLDTEATVKPELPETPPAVSGRLGWLGRAALAACVLALMFLLVLFLLRHEEKPHREIRLKQFTQNSAENPISDGLAVSPDGQYLLYGDRLGIHLRVLATGEIHTFKKPATMSEEDLWFPVAWFPDQTRFLALSGTLTNEGVRTTTWTVSALGGDSTKLRDRAIAQAVSPDGSLIAFTTGGIHEDQELWVMDANGENARALTKASSADRSTRCCMAWDPGGHRLFNLTAHWALNDPRSVDSIESRDLRGGPAITVVAHKTGPNDTWPTICGFAVLGDGRVLYSQRGADGSPEGSSDNNLWERKIDLKTGQPLGNARRLTSWFGKESMGDFSVSRDGKTLFLSKGSSQSHAYLGELNAVGPLGPLRRLTFEDSDDFPYAWTHDSRAVLFTSNRSGTYRLYKQNIDEKLAEAVNTGPGEIGIAKVSSDGQWIVYTIAPEKGRKPRLMSVPINSGAPHLIKELKQLVDIGCSFGPGFSCATVQNEKGQSIVTNLDPVTGQGREMFRMPDANWDLTLDGGIGLLRQSTTGGIIQLRSTSGTVEREIGVAPWNNLTSLDWSADRRTMYTASVGPSGATILRVSDTGKIQPLWFMPSSSNGWTIPAPDGHHVAVFGTSNSSNVWQLENY